MPDITLHNVVMNVLVRLHPPHATWKSMPSRHHRKNGSKQRIECPPAMSNGTYGTTRRRLRGWNDIKTTKNAKNTKMVWFAITPKPKISHTKTIILSQIGRGPKTKLCNVVLCRGLLCWSSAEAGAAGPVNPYPSFLQCI